MHVAVEISLYPLAEDFIPVIRGFIERLRAHDGLRVHTNSMSTQVSGDYPSVMAALQTEIGATFEGDRRAVFVMKVLGGGD